MFTFQFKGDQDPLIFRFIYLEEEKSFKNICHQEKPFGVAFKSKIGPKVASVNKVEEIVIYSTYKTNLVLYVEYIKMKKSKIYTTLLTDVERAKVRTVCDNGIVIWNRISNCLLFIPVGGRDDGAEQVKEQSLSRLYGFLRQSCPTWSPTSFFTDKESSQINTIISVFKNNLPLCIWHMLRLIKRKIVKCRKNSSSRVSTSDESALLSILHTPYSSNKIICDKIGDELRSIATEKIQSFFCEEMKTSFLMIYF